MLRPQKNVTKYLLSSPASFVGEAELNEDFLFTIAFPISSIEERLSYTLQKSNPLNRGFYVLALKDLETEGGRYQDPRAELLLIAASVWYGKRFDNLGILEKHGVHALPLHQPRIATRFFHAGFWNSLRRVNAGPELNLSNFTEFVRKIFSNSVNSEALRFFFVAGSFYLSALQAVALDAAKAYLDLVLAIEVLSGFYEYSEDELYDAELKAFISRLLPADAKFIKGRFYQVSRKYRMTFARLLTNEFFAAHEAGEPQYGLQAANAMDYVRSAYDLRSKYVHEGFPIQAFTDGILQLRTEIQVGQPVIGDKVIDKYQFAPTLIGLERMVRFALLRFFHLHALPLSLALDGTGLA